MRKPEYSENTPDDRPYEQVSHSPRRDLNPESLLAVVSSECLIHYTWALLRYESVQCAPRIMAFLTFDLHMGLEVASGKPFCSSTLLPLTFTRTCMWPIEIRLVH